MADRPSSDPQTVPGSRPRVVVVSHGPPMRGGIATVALDIVEDPGLNEAFDIVFVNTSQNDDGRGEFGIENIVRAVRHGVDTFRAARRGAVVHTHSVQHPVFVAWRQVAIALAARLRGARVILHNHGFLPYMCEPGGYRVGAAHRAAFWLLDRICSANVLIGDAGIANMRPYMATIDLPVVHNSVVVDEVVASRGVHEPPVLLFVGELLERKGLEVLLDALDLVDSRDPARSGDTNDPGDTDPDPGADGGADPGADADADACAPAGYELRIVGDDTAGLDPDKDSMVTRIRQRGRGGALTGPVARSEVYRHMSEADIFVLPTEYEGQPFTIIEALAAGVPIIASDIPAIRSMVSGPDNAVLVPWADPTALADAIGTLLADPERRSRMSATNRELARASFDRPVFRRRLADLYNRYSRS